MGMFNPGWFRDRGEAVLPSATGDVAASPVDAIRQESRPPTPVAMAHDPVQVIYASETGVAEHLARDTFRALHDAGVASTLLPFDELDLDSLQAVGHALFLVSTCYDGDPPDMAEEFCRKHMGQPGRLPELRYGLLALGDSYYDEFCGFGRQLHRWLQASGARALFEPVEMDDEDEVAARCWHDNIGVMIRSRHGDGPAAA